MADTYAFVVRFLHILSGVIWVGGIFLWGMVIAPSVARRVAPQARGPFMKEVLPRLSRYLTIAGVATILTGFWTIAVVNGGWGNVEAVFQSGTYGSALGAGVVLALAMMTIGLAVIQPAAAKLLDFMTKAPAPAPGTPPGPPPPAVMALQKRLMIAGMVNLALGTLALGTMAWAVNAVRMGA